MKKRVLLWILLESGVWRNACRGIYRYARLHAPDWDFLYADPARHSLDTILSWTFDGLIGAFRKEKQAQAVRAAAPFCVSIQGGAPCGRLLQTGVSDTAIGAAAADYFLRLKFDHFGFFGVPGIPFSDNRWNGYRQRLAEFGKTAVQFTFPGMKWYINMPPDYGASTRRALTRWLLDQPRPLALFVMDDRRTDPLYALCRENNLMIPEDVALLGVNDEDIYCFKNTPHLSSIQVPSDMAGYCAARMLDRLFRGGGPPRTPLLLDPGPVIERASTDIFNIHDEQLAKALRFIDEHAVHGIRSREIARAAGLSQRVLEKRFRAHLNSSPLAEVRRMQIEKAKVALRETNLTLEQIAESAGFASGNYLSQTFKKITGQTPGTYRRNFR